MKVEIRNDSVLIEGYVNAVARDSKVLVDKEGKFVEQVLPKTFQRALEKNTVDILLNHNKDRKLGDTNTNLRLREDNIGLYAKAEITDAEVIEKAKNNELRGWSFGFAKVKDYKEPTTKEGINRRFLEDIILREVSILDNTKTPAYDGTSIETRDNSTEIIELRCFENDIEIVDNTIEEEREFINYDAIKAEVEIIKLKYNY